jgi:hypothetical protein
LNYSAKCLAGVAAASVFIATAFLPTPARPQLTPESWQSQRIHQIITGRFFDAASSWTNIAQPVIGTGGVLVLNDSGSTTDAVEYYRVQAH